LETAQEDQNPGGKQRDLTRVLVGTLPGKSDQNWSPSSRWRIDQAESRCQLEKTVATNFEAKPEKTVATCFEAKPPETVATGFEAKPVKTVATGFEAKPLEIVTPGFEAKPAKPSEWF
jgi:hypothetical protein